MRHNFEKVARALAFTLDLDRAIAARGNLTQEQVAAMSEPELTAFFDRTNGLTTNTDTRNRAARRHKPNKETKQ